MSHEVKSPMPAKVLEVHVKAGDAVSADTVVVTLESMKMEMPIEAEVGGTVESVFVEPDATITKDAVLITIS